ncbi:MAG: bifunctional hydroxymethylpyrimidine kinase/phosphomethylpyrimidine kinase [Candidatus Sabulitectum sp.]|nr:bifunctional hydroxymethylpyrimidine kinase/phosphomethylpyrimidine kinase [Candidatus Sabulitectum sp.]
MNSRPVILLTGGTDPSGGAGLAADIKSCSALGGHGCICVTAVTVQNSGGVDSWIPVPPHTIADQMNATCNDGLPDGIKTGMLGSQAAVKAVADVISKRLNGIPYVLDPVMVAGSGDGLAEESLETAIREYLLPLATLVTPNLDEAEAFTGKPVRDRTAMEKAALEIRAMGAESVLVKGGHLEGEPADVLATSAGITWFQGSRIIPGKVHGTGCTLASSCATLLAAGYTPEKAVSKALVYLRGAIAGSFKRELGTLLGHFPAIGPLPENTDSSAFYRTPRFCPACAGELVKAEPHPICSRCGLIFYRNPLPAVVLVLKKNGKVLLARRAAAPAKGELGLPGGFIDLGEGPETAARRELMEETKLTGDSFELIGTDADHTDYGSIVLYIYEVVNWRGTPEASDDVSELLWKEIENVPQLAFPAHDRVIDKMKDERSHYGTG